MATVTKTPRNSKPAQPTTSPQQKFARAQAALCSALVERDAEVELLLTALIAREHCLLVGAPGTAKTTLMDGLAGWMGNATLFPYLLTKFTDPGELFGPIDVVALTEERKTQRAVEGFLPTAQLAFLDEVFKGSSAILNTILTVMQERRFRCGLQEVQCPLAMLMGASNEWPNDQDDNKDLGALFDRFLFRKTVRPVSANAGRKALLKMAVENRKPVPTFTETITPAELLTAHEEAKQLPWTNDAKVALVKILTDLNTEGIFPSDRRMVKAVMATRASAYLSGACEVQPVHLEVLQHVLWDDPTEQPAKAAKIVGKIANPTGAIITEQLLALEDVLSKVKDKPSAIQATPELEKIQQTLERLPTDTRRDRALHAVSQALMDVSFTITGAKRFQQQHSGEQQ